MPLYTYQCSKCPNEEEHIVKFEDRDRAGLSCGRCGAPMDRAGVEPFKTGKPRHQMGAVLGNGAHVKGHFGKEAKLDPLKRKKR